MHRPYSGTLRLTASAFLVIATSLLEACSAPDAQARPSSAASTTSRSESVVPLTSSRSDRTPIPPGDPRTVEVTFPALSGWNGTLVLDNGGVGVWTLSVCKVFETYACPEIVGLDDKGRCHILWGYSGKWTPVTLIADGTWLGGLALADVDARIPGTELYVGAQSGNIYQVVDHPDRVVDYRRIARIAGREVHTLLAGEVDPHSAGPELIAFTLPGGVYALQPKPAEQDGFQVRLLAEIQGRVRDVCALPQRPGEAPEFAVVMRTGELAVLAFTAGGPEFTPVLQVGTGLGRLALHRSAPRHSPVLYATADDGRVFRCERDLAGGWSHELIHVGAQGLRGIVCGRFDPDPSVETVAIHGYSHRVELLARRNGRWSSTTVFVDEDKGHWLAAGELDGRNATDEIVCSGYSGRIVMLARPPGTGLDGTLSVSPSAGAR